MLIGGFIFDFNGVLVNDEPVHCYAFQQALKEEQLSVNLEEYYEKYLPYDDHDFFLHFLREHGRPTDSERIRHLMELKSQHYLRSIEQSIPVIQPSLDFLRSLASRMPLAIASGAARNEIGFILDLLDLRRHFSGVISAQDVVNGKPHPEAFLKALQILRKMNSSLAGESVVVIEDSVGGIASARSAGMRCLALTTSYRPDQLANADLVLESLEGWTLSRLEKALDSWEPPQVAITK